MSNQNQISELSSSYNSCRTILAIFSFTLCCWHWLGLELTEEIPFTGLKVSNVRYVPFIIGLVVVYSLIRLMIEWCQLSVARKKQNALKVDVFLSIALALTALFPLVAHAVSGIGVTKVALLWILGLILQGLWIGSQIDQVIFSVLMIRGDERAKTLGLPRIPVVSKSIFAFALLTTIPMLIITLGVYRWMPPPVSSLWYVAIITSVIFPPLMGQWSMFNTKDAQGKTIPFTKHLDELRKVVDAHDAMYKSSNTADDAVKHGQNPLSEALGRYNEEKHRNPVIFKAAESGDIDQVREQLRVGASPNVVALGGWTPLMIACANRRHDIVKLLLDSGADPDATNAMGATAIHFASKYEALEIVRILIDNGANVNIRDKVNSQTPLFLAAMTGDVTIVSYLLENGADPAVLDLANNTALDIAIEKRHGNVAAVLRKLKATNKELS